MVTLISVILDAQKN